MSEQSQTPKTGKTYLSDGTVVSLSNIEVESAGQFGHAIIDTTALYTPPTGYFIYAFVVITNTVIDSYTVVSGYLDNSKLQTVTWTAPSTILTKLESIKLASGSILVYLGKKDS